MKKSAYLVGVAALLCAAVLHTTPVRAGEQISVTLITGQEPAQFVITSPENAAINLSERLEKHSTKVGWVADGVGYYKVVVTMCGRTAQLRWNRAGKGVIISTASCDAISLRPKW